MEPDTTRARCGERQGDLCERRPSAAAPAFRKGGAIISLENSLNSNWRAPSAAEAERIADWAQKVLRSDSITLSKGDIIVLVIVGAVVLLIVMGTMPIEMFLIMGGMFGVPMIVVIVLMLRRDERKRKQLLSGDYLIMDSFVISKKVFRSGYGKSLHIYAKIPYGYDRYIRVSSTIYNALTPNTPGFLIRYGRDKPVNQGVAKAFFPAIPVED